MTANGKTPLLVSRKELVNSMLDYFKLRNQRYPPEMVQNLDKMWAEIFGNIKSAGWVLVRRETLEDRFIEANSRRRRDVKMNRLQRILLELLPPFLGAPFSPLAEETPGSRQFKSGPLYQWGETMKPLSTLDVMELEKEWSKHPAENYGKWQKKMWVNIAELKIFVEEEE